MIDNEQVDNLDAELVSRTAEEDHETDLDVELADLMDEDGAGPAALADAIVSPPPAPPTVAKRRDDPSIPPYPRGLVLDLLLKTAPVADLLVAYKLSVEDFKRLTQHPVFRQDMREVREKMREEGFSVKVKLQAQAEEYLSQSWKMVHDPDVPASVRADLIKWTFANSGLQQKTAAPSAAEDMSKLAEAVKGMSSHDLELRVLQITMKRGQNAAKDEGALYEG